MELRGLDHRPLDIVQSLMDYCLVLRITRDITDVDINLSGQVVLEIMLDEQ